MQSAGTTNDHLRRKITEHVGIISIHTPRPNPGGHVGDDKSLREED